MASQCLKIKIIYLHVGRLEFQNVCFILIAYHTYGVRTTKDDLTSYVSDNSIGAKFQFELTVVFKLLIDNLFTTM